MHGLATAASTLAALAFAGPAAPAPPPAGLSDGQLAGQRVVLSYPGAVPPEGLSSKHMLADFNFAWPQAEVGSSRTPCRRAREPSSCSR